MSARGVQLACVAAMMASGCGTIDNVGVRYPLSPPAPSEPPNRIYGGVVDDAKEFWGLAKIGPLAVPTQYQPIYAIQLLGSMLDLPLSAVGDTLTLPVTIPATIARHDAPSAADRFLAGPSDNAGQN